MVKQLREYQQQAVDAARLHLYDKGYAGTLIHLATGLGKTVLAVELVKQGIDLHKQRVMFIVNYQTIIHQSHRAFLDQMPELRESSWTKYGLPGAGIVMGSYNDSNARVIVGTPQTLSSIDGPSARLAEVLRHGPIDLAIYDEAHYSVAKSYMAMHYDGLKKVNPDVRALGLTATPVREDGLALNQMFNTICYSRNIRWGIANGFLCDILPPLIIETHMELPDGRGDVDERARALDMRNWAQLVAQGWSEHGEGRPTVSFMPSVDHSIEFVKYLREELGIQAAHIDGEKTIGPDGAVLPINARYEMFRLHQQGDIQILSNFNVLTTGWDAPWVSCILNARPTENAVLLTQMIGRGTRLYPGKPNLKVLDFTLNNVGILLTGTLLGHTWDEVGKAEDEVEVEPLLEGMDLRDFKPDDALVNGNGLVVRVGSLFRKLSDAWYHDPDTGTLSLGASDCAMFLIHSPNYTLAARIREGIANGENYLAREDLTEEERDRGEWFLDQLLKAFDLYSQYTAWFVQGVRNEMTGKVAWKKPSGWVASADSVELVFDYIAPVLSEVEDPALAKKNKTWRGPKYAPTPAQVDLLRKFGVPVTPLTRGEASQMIGHNMAWSKVQPVIETMRDNCGKYGELINAF